MISVVVKLQQSFKLRRYMNDLTMGRFDIYLFYQSFYVVGENKKRRGGGSILSVESYNRLMAHYE